MTIRLGIPSRLHRTLTGLVIVAGLWLCATATTAQEHIQRNELGISLAKQNHLDDALREFVIILTSRPDDASAMNNVANVYALTGRWQQARKSYEKALARAPDDGGINLNLALVFHALDSSQESSRHMQEGLRKIGDIEQAYFMLGLSSVTGSGAARASGDAAMSDAEIEALLASALAAVTADAAEASVPVPTQSPAEPGVPVESAAEVDTYQSGTKAGANDAQTTRYYWKSSLAAD